MRFFTLEWWRGVQVGSDDDLAVGYASRLAAIRENLPPDLIATEESVSLHDSRLRHLRLITEDRSLTLAFSNYAGDERITLHYSGVERFESIADPNAGLGGPFGYGDLGYCEVDLLPGGSFEHRLLFSSGIELVVAFSGFRLQRGDAA